MSDGAERATSAIDPGSIYASLPGDRRERRRAAVRTALRCVAMTVGLLVLYVVVPVPEDLGAGAILVLAAGLVALIGLAGWQIRAIVLAEHPVLRALELLAFAVPLVVVVFAYTYLALAHADAESFSEHLNRVDALYFAVTTMCTVGFGDITAETSTARLLLTAQMLFDLALIGILVRLVILATRTGVHRRVAASAPEASE